MPTKILVAKLDDIERLYETLIKFQFHLVVMEKGEFGTGNPGVYLWIIQYDFSSEPVDLEDLLQSTAQKAETQYFARGYSCYEMEDISTFEAAFEKLQRALPDFALTRA